MTDTAALFVKNILFSCRFYAVFSGISDAIVLSGVAFRNFIQRYKNFLIFANFYFKNIIFLNGMILSAGDTQCTTKSRVS